MKIKNDDCPGHENREEEANVNLINKDIFIFGEINNRSVGMFLMAFAQADMVPGIIRVFICSAGGWVEGGLAMYDTIKSAQNDVITIASGVVYSAAVLPFSAGDLRVMQKNTKLFLHPFSLTVEDATIKTIDMTSKETKELFKI